MTEAQYREIAERVIQSETFKLSKNYQNLLAYLVDCSLRDEVPKETTIAIEIFDKGPEFNPAESTIVRVSIYNLRKKLKEYYDTEGRDDRVKLVIPKGNYRVEWKVLPAKEKTQVAKQIPWKKLSFLFIIIIVVLFSIILVNFSGSQNSKNSLGEMAIPSNSVWEPFLNPLNNTMVVLGDLFVYAEQDELTNRNRTIRDMSINSDLELDAFLDTMADYTRSVSRLPYSLLIKSSAFCMKDISPLFFTHQKDFNLRVMSRFNSEDLYGQQIVFVGLLKTLGIFEQYFKSSQLNFIENNQMVRLDSLGNQISYVQDGNPVDFHTDYGLVAKFKGPDDNAIILFSGFQDTGVLQAVKNFTDLELLKQNETLLREKFGYLPENFEMLFKVTGVDRTELNSQVVYMNELPAQNSIW